MRKIFIIPLVFCSWASITSSGVNASEINCNSPVWKNQEECKNLVGSKKVIDKNTGLEVIEYIRDVDWKKRNPKIAWSKIIRFKSLITGDYDLTIFDRDYKTIFSSGYVRSYVTKWTVSKLNGHIYCWDMWLGDMLI